MHKPAIMSIHYKILLASSLAIITTSIGTLVASMFQIVDEDRKPAWFEFGAFIIFMIEVVLPAYITSLLILVANGYYRVRMKLLSTLDSYML